MEQIKIQLSAPLFSGYSIFLPKEVINQMNKENIIDYVTSNLNSLLKSNNLEILLEKSENMNWHIHDELIKSDGVIYVCSNCTET
tara:strand:- start:2748 stop:3002 length:255 start_codon:yes stop_codon:yes gene_type:complete